MTPSHRHFLHPFKRHYTEKYINICTYTVKQSHSYKHKHSMKIYRPTNQIVFICILVSFSLVCPRMFLPASQVLGLGEGLRQSFSTTRIIDFSGTYRDFTCSHNQIIHTILSQLRKILI